MSVWRGQNGRGPESQGLVMGRKQPQLTSHPHHTHYPAYKDDLGMTFPDSHHRWTSKIYINIRINPSCFVIILHVIK